MKELPSECWYCWLYTSSFSADIEGVLSSSIGCTPCGKQKCAASGVIGLFSGYWYRTCRSHKCTSVTNHICDKQLLLKEELAITC